MSSQLKFHFSVLYYFINGIERHKNSNILPEDIKLRIIKKLINLSSKETNDLIFQACQKYTQLKPLPNPFFDELKPQIINLYEIVFCINSNNQSDVVQSHYIFLNYCEHPTKSETFYMFQFLKYWLENIIKVTLKLNTFSSNDQHHLYIFLDSWKQIVKQKNKDEYDNTLKQYQSKNFFELLILLKYDNMPCIKDQKNELINFLDHLPFITSLPKYQNLLPYILFQFWYEYLLPILKLVDNKKFVGLTITILDLILKKYYQQTITQVWGKFYIHQNYIYFLNDSSPFDLAKSNYNILLQSLIQTFKGELLIPDKKEYYIWDNDLNLISVWVSEIELFKKRFQAIYDTLKKFSKIIPLKNRIIFSKLLFDESLQNETKNDVYFYTYLNIEITNHLTNLLSNLNKMFPHKGDYNNLFYEYSLDSFITQDGQEFRYPITLLDDFLSVGEFINPDTRKKQKLERKDYTLELWEFVPPNLRKEDKTFNA